MEWFNLQNKENADSLLIYCSETWCATICLARIWSNNVWIWSIYSRENKMSRLCLVQCYLSFVLLCNLLCFPSCGCLKLLYFTRGKKVPCGIYLSICFTRLFLLWLWNCLEALCLIQVRYCMEECEICSNLGVLEGWIRINPKIFKPRLQAEICWGISCWRFLVQITCLAFYLVYITLVADISLPFGVCSIIFEVFKKLCRIGNPISLNGWLSS